MAGRNEDTLALGSGQHFKVGMDDSAKYCREARRDAVNVSTGSLNYR